MIKVNKVPTKPKDQVKIPDTIYVISDIFLDYDRSWSKNYGFSYNKEDAEKIRAAREDEMMKGSAMFVFYNDKFVSEWDDLLKSDFYENKMKEHSHFENYSRTDVQELKQIKRVK